MTIADKPLNNTQLYPKSQFFFVFSVYFTDEKNLTEYPVYNMMCT